MCVRVTGESKCPGHWGNTYACNGGKLSHMCMCVCPKSALVSASEEFWMIRQIGYKFSSTNNCKEFRTSTGDKKSVMETY